MASAKEFVRTILRVCGPLSLADMVKEATDKGYVTTRNPRQTITSALSQDTLIQNTGEGTYAYLPTFMRGARMRVLLNNTNRTAGTAIVSDDIMLLLWPSAPYADQATAVTLQLPDTTIQVTYGRLAHVGPDIPNRMYARIQFPEAFWTWWDTQAAEGADTIVVECVDGEAGVYRVEAAQDTDPTTLGASNELMRRTAEGILRRMSDGTMISDLVRRLLAHGVYHQSVPPAPLADALFNPPGHFVLENGHRIRFRPEMKPAIRRLFAQRLGEAEEDAILLPFGKRPPDEGPRYVIPPAVPASAVYRFKVALGWNKRVWRVIEILDNQTLEDFHDTIQEAFDWDDDHLYAFYISNRRSDWLTAINRPTDFDFDPPHANEVTIGMLDLNVGQSILYVFDFGDHLDHAIELMQIVELPAEGTFPRIVLSHGEAPEQYPDYEDEDEEE